jgi:aspartoacylase
VPLQEDGSETWPVFINEAAYAEKRIAFSLTRREVWPIDPSWGQALEQLMD